MANRRRPNPGILSSPDIGVDAGSFRTRMAIAGQGVVVDEASLVAIDTQRGGRIVAVGDAARTYEEQDLPDIRAVRPIRAGVIADFTQGARMFQRFVRRALPDRTLLGPRAVATLPTEATAVEHTALHDALRAAGCRMVVIIDQLLAAWVGSGLSTGEEGGRVVCNIGAGATDIGVIARGRVVFGRTLRYGGGDLDEALRRAVRRRYGILLPSAAARALKARLGAIDPSLVDEAMLCGCPLPLDMERTLSPAALCALTDVLAAALSPIVRELEWMVEDLTPERLSQIAGTELVLTGGGAMLRGTAEYIGHRIGLPTVVARDPRQAAIIGLNAMLQNFDGLSEDGKRFRRLSGPSGRRVPS